MTTRSLSQTVPNKRDSTPENGPSQAVPHPHGTRESQPKTACNQTVPGKTLRHLQDSLIFPAIAVSHLVPYYVGRRYNPRATPPHAQVGPRQQHQKEA